MGWLLFEPKRSATKAKSCQSSYKRVDFERSEREKAEGGGFDPTCASVMRTPSHSTFKTITSETDVDGNEVYAFCNCVTFT
jgi:hypothetical protein